MLRLRRSLAVAVALVTGSLVFAGSAQAQFRDSAGNVHFQAAGQTPGVSLQASTGELSRKLTANYCGILPISKPSSTVPIPASINVNGTAISTSALPVLSAPSCVNNVLSEARPADFKTAEGRVYLVGRTPGVQYTVSYPGIPAPKSIPVNPCGYGRLSNTLANPVPATFTFNGTSYTTASLPVQNPNICVTSGGVSTKYAPVP
ncbi:MAG TPA: hypothetical protein V6D18_19235 [Thermosynechococcaceae cyanobacterium]